MLTYLVVSDKKLFRPSDVNNLKGDSSKAKKELNWKPKIDLIDGLAKTIDFYEKKTFKIKKKDLQFSIN